MRVLGVDPGKKTGLAVYEDGKLKLLQTVTKEKSIEFIVGSGVDLVVFEDSRLQSTTFRRTSKNGKPLSAAAQLKIARDVGGIDAQCRDIEAACLAHGIGKIAISPKQKGAKIDHVQFALKTGWAGSKSNQHERDSAMVAWGFRLAAANPEFGAGR
ncbi:MAG: hypothetical protein ABL933_15725 [Methyloglobulus sp.]